MKKFNHVEVVMFAIMVVFSFVLLAPIVKTGEAQTCLDGGWDTSYLIDGVTYCGADADHDGTGVIYLVNVISVEKALEIMPDNE